MLKVNTCGMSCPQPVLMTKKALAQNPAEVEVITDNLTAKNNVERFLKNAGYNVEIKKADTDEEDYAYILLAKK